MELVIVYAAVFVGGLILFERLVSFIQSRVVRSTTINYRMKLLESGDDSQSVYRAMVRERALDYDRAGYHPVVVTRRIFAQSGLKFEPVRMALYFVPGALVIWLALGFFDFSAVSRGAVILVLAIALPLLVTFRARASRIRKVTVQLPDALDIMSRSLSAGHPLPTAIALVSREMPDPIGTEFGMLSDELTYGIELDKAMLNMLERTGVEELKLLAISMSVQAGTGGNFIEVLQNVSAVLRERGLLRAKVKALSAEGRFTAIVMSGFPFYLFFLIRTIAPTYFDPVFQSGYQNIIITIALVLIVIGNLILYRLVNFEF